MYTGYRKYVVNTLRPQQNGFYFADGIIKLAIFNEDFLIWI